MLFEGIIRSVIKEKFPAAAEAATLKHEFGHLFGLVGQGAPEIFAHQDQFATNHCRENGCLMQASLENAVGLEKALAARAAKIFTAVPDLDLRCVLDLRGIGGR